KFTVAYPLLEFGLYYEQVKRFLTCFGEARVSILLYEEYSRDLKLSLQRIYRLLDVDPDFAADTSQRFHEPQVPRLRALTGALGKLRAARLVKKLTPPPWQAALKRAAFRRRESLVMNAADRANLIGYYKDDVGKLADLIGRDLG